jgi:molecular chaperone HscA
LAHFQLCDIPPLPAGQARIDVTFAVDRDGLLTVSAKERTTGQAQHVDVNATYGLSEETLIHMLKESFAHAGEDLAQRVLIESRWHGRKLLTLLTQALDEDGHLLEAHESESLFKAMDHLEQLLKGTDRDAIEHQATQLNQLAQTFADRRMGHAVRALIAGRTVQEVAQDLCDR